jgi:ceramide glucosyltransferase
MVPRMTFTLGACTGVKRADLEAIGGFEAFSNALAEDHELGRRLVQSRRSVQLSRCVLDLDSDPMSWRDYFRHQHRMAVTYRAANPAGALGLPIFFVLPLAIGAALLNCSVWKWAAGVIVLRAIFAIVQARLAGIGRGLHGLLAGAVPLFEIIFWIVGWLPFPVWWAGKWRTVTWRGRL